MPQIDKYLNVAFAIVELLCVFHDSRSAKTLDH